MKRTVNICQPGHGASCALCCGSHNIVGGRAALHAEFSRRAYGMELRPSHGTAPAANTAEIGPSASIEGIRPPREFADGIQCPHVGFIDTERTLIGCLVYAGRGGGPGTRGFFEYTCRNFSCAARETLDDDEVFFAARLMHDWYYYGPLINSILLLKRLFRDYRFPENVPTATLEAVKRRLDDSLYGRPLYDDDPCRDTGG